MNNLYIDDLDAEARRPLLSFPESSELGQLEVFDDADLLASIKYDSNDSFWMKFRKARAYRSRREPYCTLYHLTRCYEQLIEIEGSAWQAEIRDRGKVSGWVLRHFMFYAASHGCVEVIAEDYETGGMDPLPPDMDAE